MSHKIYTSSHTHMHSHTHTHTHTHTYRSFMHLWDHIWACSSHQIVGPHTIFVILWDQLLADICFDTNQWREGDTVARYNK